VLLIDFHTQTANSWHICINRTQTYLQAQTEISARKLLLSLIRELTVVIY